MNKKERLAQNILLLKGRLGVLASCLKYSTTETAFKKELCLIFETQSYTPSEDEMDEILKTPLLKFTQFYQEPLPKPRKRKSDA